MVCRGLCSGDFYIRQIRNICLMVMDELKQGLWDNVMRAPIQFLLFSCLHSFQFHKIAANKWQSKHDNITDSSKTISHNICDRKMILFLDNHSLWNNCIAGFIILLKLANRLIHGIRLLKFLWHSTKFWSFMLPIKLRFTKKAMNEHYLDNDGEVIGFFVVDDRFHGVGEFHESSDVVLCPTSYEKSRLTMSWR